jgi:F0F1-type ATP synthase assembly protein I
MPIFDLEEENQKSKDTESVESIKTQIEKLQEIQEDSTVSSLEEDKLTDSISSAVTDEVSSSNAEIVDEKSEKNEDFTAETEPHLPISHDKIIRARESKKDAPSLSFLESTTNENHAEDSGLGRTIREGGLAWSAAIGLVASIVFMMIIGWIVDTLLESKPIGIVAGIILGSVIGFYQFFKITSQIFSEHE